MKIALCQLGVGDNKTLNISRAEAMLDKAGKAGVDMAILPEMFSIRYSLRLFPSASEPLTGDSFNMIKAAAKRNRITVVGGSFLEQNGDKLYNTSVSFNKNGELLGIYRKAHLFDVDFGSFSFMESSVITRGENEPLVFDAELKTGVSICFDIRFPNWINIMRKRGVEFIALPAAFSLATGPTYWELLVRSRALDNQCFFAGVSPAQSKSAYGFSMVAAPDGTVLAKLGADEELLLVDITQEAVYEARKAIPIYR
ncbi:MAG: nitrilase-related carbon-nitrogen hydrolase [Clostridia bacterium]